MITDKENRPRRLTRKFSWEADCDEPVTYSKSRFIEHLDTSDSEHAEEHIHDLRFKKEFVTQPAKRFKIPRKAVNSVRISKSPN